jgi:hypothetical protein
MKNEPGEPQIRIACAARRKLVNVEWRAPARLLPPDVFAPVAAFPGGPEPPRPVQPAMHPIEMATKYDLATRSELFASK